MNISNLIVLPVSLSFLAGCANHKQMAPQEPIRYLCSDNNMYLVSTRVDQNQAELLTLSLPNGQNITMINVVAASGTKYVGSIYEWWSKGHTASFSDLNTQLQCNTVEN